MSTMTCPIHGSQTFYHVCEHIWEDYENGIIPSYLEFPVIPLNICEKCYKDLKVDEVKEWTIEKIIKLPDDEGNRIEEILNSKYEKLKNTNYKCTECINKIKLIDARKTGKELPFEPFENTLQFEDSDTIKYIEKELNNRFNFHEYQFYPAKNSNPFFYLQGGSIAYPFSMNFYCIYQYEEQFAILEFIDKLFENIPKKQRKINFYEAITWIVNQKTGSRRKAKTKLLLEKLVK